MYDFLTVCPTCQATITATPHKMRGEYHDMAFCPTCRKTWDVCCAPEYRLTTVVTQPVITATAQGASA